MNKREAIIHTTLRLITSQGFHASPMSQIAKEAGVATGTIYHYFENKNELIKQVYKEVKKEMGEALMYDYQEKLSYKKQFKIFWKHLYYFFVNNPLKFNFLEQFHHSPFINEETLLEGQEYYQPVLDFFQRGIEEEQIKNLNLKLISQLIYGNIVTVARLHLHRELKINEAHIDQAVNASWDSVKKLETKKTMIYE